MMDWLRMVFGSTPPPKPPPLPPRSRDDDDTTTINLKKTSERLIRESAHRKNTLMTSVRGVRDLTHSHPPK